MRSSCGGLGECRAFEHGPEIEDRPLLTGTCEGACQIALTSRNRRWCIARKLTLGEASEPEHLIDQQAGGNFAVVHHHNARVTGQWRHATPQEEAQIDDGQKLTSNIRKSLY